uniref:Uncharacterized protein n=1 Tax=Aegilops tauschii TaxID=37682 RepID=M8C2U8_AEGTA
MWPPRALPVDLDPTSAVGAQADERGLNPDSAGGHAPSHSPSLLVAPPRWVHFDGWYFHVITG